jgi:hypothetical protein
MQTNNQMIEAYVSAWTSGAFETAVVGGSMSFALALHHIFGYIFIAGNVVKEKLALNKVITTLVQSSTQRVQQQVNLCFVRDQEVVLRSLVLCAPYSSKLP